MEHLDLVQNLAMVVFNIVIAHVQIQHQLMVASAALDKPQKQKHAIFKAAQV